MGRSKGSKNWTYSESLALINTYEKFDVETIQQCYFPEKSVKNIRDKACVLGLTQKLVKRSVNEHLFEEFTPTSAYLLGAIASDGCVSLYKGCYKLLFGSMDYDWTKTIRDLMESDVPIVETIGVGFKKDGHLYRIQIASKHITESLQALGITPRKSLTLEFPTIPSEFVPDFMRGYNDGDGGFGISKSKDYPKNQYLRTGVVGTEKFLIEWKRQLVRLGIDTKNKVIGPNTSQYAFYMAGKNAVKFGDLIYYDESLPKLERKYTIYKNYKQSHCH